MFARLKSSFLLAPALFLCGAAHAQVVNIESRRFMNDTVPWTGFVNFRFNVSESGQRSLNFGLNGAVQYIHGKDRWFFINDLAFSQVEANDFLNTGFQHFRYNYRKDSLWTGEAFAQAQYNKPLKLDLRLTLGAGPRLTALNTRKWQVNLGTALMLEREAITDGPVEVVGRSSSYAAATLKFSAMVSLTGVAYYQPKVFDASDQRVALEGAFLIAVSKQITLESRINLLKDSTPPQGVNDMNYSWTNMFGYRF
ncbi:MAG: DUF481 domain-containing protein [Flavobacteriales bacterium]|nr:DUF481 domain-containing protein [Flavobacteriales bacterium]